MTADEIADLEADIGMWRARAERAEAERDAARQQYAGALLEIAARRETEDAARAEAAQMREALTKLCSWAGNPVPEDKEINDEWRAMVREVRVALATPSSSAEWLQAKVAEATKVLEDSIDARVEIQRQTNERLAAAEARVAMLVEAIKEHAAQKRDDRCWLDDAALYSAAGLSPSLDVNTALPPRDEFLANCARFHTSRQHPGHVYETQADHDRRIRDDERSRTWREACEALARQWDTTPTGTWFPSDIAAELRALAARGPKGEPQ